MCNGSVMYGKPGALRAGGPGSERHIHELAESDLLAGDQSVEVMEVESGDHRVEALARALDQTRSSKRRRADSNR